MPSPKFPHRYLRLETLAMPGAAIGFFGLGLLFFFLIGQTSILRCARVENNQVDCTLTTTWMKLRTLRERQIEQLQAAQVETDCDDDGCTYRVLIATTGYELPLSEAYTSDEGEHRALAKKINDFLKDPNQRSLEVETGGGWMTMIPVLFIAVGVVFAALSTRSIFS